MPEPGSPEWKERVAKVLEEEAQDVESSWYLSFADEKQFRGAVIVRARGLTFALKRAHELGINPGGQVVGFAISEQNEHLISDDMRDRLLSREELEAFDGSKTELPRVRS